MPGDNVKKRKVGDGKDRDEQRNTQMNGLLVRTRSVYSREEKQSDKGNSASTAMDVVPNLGQYGINGHTKSGDREQRRIEGQGKMLS